jgi:hypothetical protein
MATGLNLSSDVTAGFPLMCVRVFQAINIYCTPARCEHWTFGGK